MLIFRILRPLLVLTLLALAQSAGAVQLSIAGAAINPPGTSTTVALALDDASAVEAMRVSLQFDPSVVSVLGVSNTGPTAGCLLDSISPVVGQLVIGLACGGPIGGAVAIVEIAIRGDAVGSSVLGLSACLLNEGTPACQVRGNVVVVSNATETPTATYTATDTPTSTAMATATSTPPDTATATSTGVSTDTPTDSPTATPTPTATATATASNTPTASNTATFTPTPANTFTRTNTPTATNTFTRTNSPTATDTFTRTNSPTATYTPTSTPTPTAPNLAVGQVATQSSTAFGGVAGRAVDGNTNGAFGGGSVTHTGGESSAWWEVDLGVQAQIDSIEIWNRSDCCGSRLSQYYVLISNTANPQPGAGGIFEHFEVAAAGYPTTIPINATGRYVRIQKSTPGPLSLAEVRVYGNPVPLTNLSQGQIATQSSTAFGGVASRGVDGDTNGMFSGGSVTHTAGETGAWWEVDLGTMAMIETIDLWNRAGCCQNQLSNYYILVSSTPHPQPGGAVTFERFEVATAGYPTAITVNATGRYVRVQKQGSGPLHLAEVQVWGQPISVANLAAGQVATQSSTAFGGVASRGVDGDTNGMFSGGSVTHTAGETGAWWEVDLGASATIATIDLWNRAGCCQDRLSNYYVLVSDFPNPQPGGAVIFERFEVATAGYPTTIAVNASGRYVRIQKLGSGPLSIAEALVWGQ